MPVSLYDISVPTFTRGLSNLSAILDKAASHGDAKHIDPTAIPQARLILDMLPLSAQIQIACNTAKGAVARLASVEVPIHEDMEATLGDLKTRVANTLDFVKSIKPEQLQGAETREIILQFPPTAEIRDQDPDDAPDLQRRPPALSSLRPGRQTRLYAAIRSLRSSVAVPNLRIHRETRIALEADAPLLVHPDAVVPLPTTLEGFELIVGATIKLLRQAGRRA